MGISLNRINTPPTEFGKLLKYDHINGSISNITTQSSSYIEIFKSNNINLSYPIVDLEIYYSLFVEVNTLPFVYSLKIEYSTDNELSWISLGETNGSDGSADLTYLANNSTRNALSRKVYGKNKILLKNFSSINSIFKFRFLIKSISHSSIFTTINIPLQNANVHIFQYMNDDYYSNLTLSSNGRKLIETVYGKEFNIHEKYNLSEFIFYSTSPWNIYTFDFSNIVKNKKTSLFISLDI